MGRSRHALVASAALIGLAIGASPAAAVLGPSVPAPHVAFALAAPTPRIDAAMSFHASKGNTVLFGGVEPETGTRLNDTWTWDGKHWAKRLPRHSPRPRDEAAIADDAAHGQLVLFGGDSGGGILYDTWLWNGTDWRQRMPAHRPPGRKGAAMTYDPGLGRVILFGGDDSSGQEFTDTWAWDGSDWTELSPAHSPEWRRDARLVYDEAHHDAVLFGGVGEGGARNDTWTWDGTDWTRRPAHAPSPRYQFGMEYDTAAGAVMLFGGASENGHHTTADTWLWDGTDWLIASPTHHPTARFALATAYDAARSQVVLFGGGDRDTRPFATYGDTWTWDGADWAVPFRASLALTPETGPPGAPVAVVGTGFGAGEKVVIRYVDATNGQEVVGDSRTDATGGLSVQVSIPNDATPGHSHIRARGRGSGQAASSVFVVT
jgi:hypothetical protein